VPTPFQGHEVEARLRPSAEAYRFDLDQALSSVVALEVTVPPTPIRPASWAPSASATAW
jgi:hypothetical protein